MIMKRKQTQKIEFDYVKSSNIEIPLRPNSSKLTTPQKGYIVLTLKSKEKLIRTSLTSGHESYQNQKHYTKSTKGISLSCMIHYFMIKNVSPAKLIQKQPITQSDKKIQVIPKRQEKQQFRITKKINSSVERNNSPQKVGSPNQGYEQYWVNSESTQEIDFKRQKKNNIREQHYKLQKQEFKNNIPKCAQDFSMTSHINELPQLLKNYQQEIKETRQQYMYDNSPPLNMSGIIQFKQQKSWKSMKMVFPLSPKHLSSLDELKERQTMLC